MKLPTTSSANAKTVKTSTKGQPGRLSSYTTPSLAFNTLLFNLSSNRIISTSNDLYSSAKAGCATSSGKAPATADTAAALGALRGAAAGTNAGATKRAAAKRSVMGKKLLRAIAPHNRSKQRKKSNSFTSPSTHSTHTTHLSCSDDVCVGCTASGLRLRAASFFDASERDPKSLQLSRFCQTVANKLYYSYHTLLYHTLCLDKS